MASEVNPASGPVRGWDRFFFSPADPTPLGAVRIATGLLLFWSLLVLGFDLRGFLGSGGWVDPALLASTREASDSWEWSLWNLVPDSMLRPAWVLSLVVLALFTAGVASRLTAPLAWAIAVSTSRRNPAILFGFDQIVTLWAFYLAVTGASGQGLSFDRWRKRAIEPPTPTVSARLALRLIQIHLCAIYAAAGLAKVRGISWWDGSALIKLLGNTEFRPFDMTWLLSGGQGSVYLLNAATHLALFTEIFYPVLIWVRPLRRWVLAAAVVMHIGIAVVLGLTEFSLAMLAGNLAFVSGSSIRSVTGWGRGRSVSGGLESGEKTPAPSGVPASRPRPVPPPSRPRS